MKFGLKYKELEIGVSGSLSHIEGNQHLKLLRDVTAAMNSTGYQ